VTTWSRPILAAPCGRPDLRVGWSGGRTCALGGDGAGRILRHRAPFSSVEVRRAIASAGPPSRVNAGRAPCGGGRGRAYGCGAPSGSVITARRRPRRSDRRRRRGRRARRRHRAVGRAHVCNAERLHALRDAPHFGLGQLQQMKPADHEVQRAAVCAFTCSSMGTIPGCEHPAITTRPSGVSTVRHCSQTLSVNPWPGRPKEILPSNGNVR